MNNLNSKNENFTNVNNKKKNNALNIFFSVLKGIKIFILSMFILIAIACGSHGNYFPRDKYTSQPAYIQR